MVQALHFLLAGYVAWGYNSSRKKTSKIHQTQPATMRSVFFLTTLGGNIQDGLHSETDLLKGFWVWFNYNKMN